MRTWTFALAAVAVTVLSVGVLLAQSPDTDGPGGGERNSQAGKPPPRASQPRDHAQQYSIEQAASDQAQLHTIAFSGLAFITGDYGACTFMPPGKVCDFFGFQYMRDIDAEGTGHNPKFLDRVAANVLYVLNDDQRAVFEKAARQTAVQMRTLAEKRLPLIKAFWRQLQGDIPQGSEGLNQAAVVQYLGDLFAIDADSSYQRAQIYGQVAVAFTPDQKAYLAKMKFGDFNSWPDVDMDKYKLPRGSEKMDNVAYMTYASEFFSWYAGSVEADTYFCPERHGTYFGGFYMKDMPAMGKRDYNISTSRTGDSGKAFLEALTPEQSSSITGILGRQRKALMETIEVRRAISTELRKFLKGGTADKEKVLAFGRRYGELDGEMSFCYATAFATINKTLTAQQRELFAKLRDLEGYKSAPEYIYSDPVNTAVTLPDTDHFFLAPTKAGAKGGATVTYDDAPTTKAAANTAVPVNGFALRSPEVADGGQLPKDYTGDGTSSTLPLEWSGTPDGTKSFAVIMHHVAPDMTKWYWILYNIPADVKSLPKNVKGVGTLGNNSITGKAEYAPPHSKGPGPKTYIYTVYALSAPPKIAVPPAEVSREVLLAAMKGIVLGSAELRLIYTRFPAPDGKPDREGKAPPPLRDEQ